MNNSKKNIKNVLGFSLAAMLILLQTGCFKDYNKDFLFTDPMVEFDATSWESPAPGKNFPILGPLEKGSGAFACQVNLLGEQRSTAQVIQYRIVDEETNAQEGLHFNLPNKGNVTIEANSSTGNLMIEVLDFPPQSGAVTLVLELIGNEEVAASQNYKRLGISISQVGRPSEAFPLHTQIGGDSFYNTFYVDLAQDGLSPEFMNRWNQMKANLNAFSNGGRTPYGLQVRLGEDNRARVTLLYTTASVAYTYAYASWIYDLELDADGVGRFVFVDNNDVNATNLRGAGVVAPLLENWLESYDFKLDWVDASISTPRDGAQLGGLFRADAPGDYLFGELTYITFGSNTPRPMPTSPFIYSLFDNNNGGFYTSVLIDPESTQNSQAFRDRWAAAKSNIQTNSAGRILNQFLFAFDPMFNDVVLVMSYANATETSKLIGQNRYWVRMNHSGELTLDHIFTNPNGGVTSPPELYNNYLNTEEFIVTRNGDQLRFTQKDDPSSYFEGSLGNLGIAATSFSWWF